MGFVVCMANDPVTALASKVFTVSELTANVRKTLESSIGQVCVEGEVSNYRMQASGHQYFTLKDAKAQLACVWFAGRFSGGRATPLSEGMAVQIRGALTVFEAQGKYQVNVQSVQASGTGLLQAKFDALKRRLQEEGLFDRARKRPLPPHPATVALVTSPTGSVVQDMLKVLGRRAPWVRVLVFPVRVQGQSAAAEIAEGIRFLNRESGVSLPFIDVIIAGRGGGSVEDLWCFNEEMVARAIFESAIPLVSAVGHETDFTIADFVADLRAPTPTGAAELAAPRKDQLLQELEAIKQALLQRVNQRVEREAQTLDQLALRLSHALPNPDRMREQINSWQQRLSQAWLVRMENWRRNQSHYQMQLEMLNPQRTLERGYAVILSKEANQLHAVRKPNELNTAHGFEIHLAEGQVEVHFAKVDQIESK